MGCNQPVRDEQGGYDGGQNHQPSRAAIKLPRARWQLPSPRTRHPKQPHRPLHRAGRRPPPPARHGAHTRRRAQGVRREHCVVGRAKRARAWRSSAVRLRCFAVGPNCRVQPVGAGAAPGYAPWVRAPGPAPGSASRPGSHARAAVGRISRPGIDVHRTRCTRGDLHVTDRDRSKTWQ